jgi:hypothetical protein
VRLTRGVNLISDRPNRCRAGPLIGCAEIGSGRLRSRVRQQFWAVSQRDSALRPELPLYPAAPLEVYMAEYVVGWMGLALINAAIANVDRRSPAKYLLGSLLLGPFITLVLAFTREEAGALRQVAMWEGRAVR